MCQRQEYAQGGQLDQVPHIARQVAHLLVSGAPVAGIKRLEMFPPGTDGRKRHEATGIWSPDGEWLPLLSPVVTEGRPESWLGRVEDAMFATTRKHLLKVLEDSKSEWGTGVKAVVRLHFMCGKGSSMDQNSLELASHCMESSLSKSDALYALCY